MYFAYAYGIQACIGHASNIPKMQFFTGISINTQSKSFSHHCLSVSGNSKIMLCGILINIPYCKETRTAKIALARGPWAPWAA